MTFVYLNEYQVQKLLFHLDREFHKKYKDYKFAEGLSEAVNIRKYHKKSSRHFSTIISNCCHLQNASEELKKKVRILTSCSLKRVPLYINDEWFIRAIAIWRLDIGK